MARISVKLLADQVESICAGHWMGHQYMHRATKTIGLNVKPVLPNQRFIKLTLRGNLSVSSMLNRMPVNLRDGIYTIPLKILSTFCEMILPVIWEVGGPGAIQMEMSPVRLAKWILVLARQPLAIS